MKFLNLSTAFMGSFTNKSETIPECKFEQTPDMLEAKTSRKGKKTVKNSSKKKTKENNDNIDNVVISILRRQTVQVKNEYKPQDSKDYYHNLLKSINNRNNLFLNPQFEKNNPFRNSIKVGKGYYNTKVSVFSKESKFKGIESRVIDLNVDSSKIVNGIIQSESIDFAFKSRGYRESNFEEQDFQNLKQNEDHLETETFISICDINENEAKINSIPFFYDNIETTNSYFNLLYFQYVLWSWYFFYLWFFSPRGL